MYSYVRYERMKLSINSGRASHALFTKKKEINFSPTFIAVSEC
jgi:hypothetical protein